MSDTDARVLHQPVLLADTVALLDPSRGGVYVDCTIGLGGHTRALFAGGASRVIGLDRDADALAIAAESLGDVKERLDLVHSDYRQLARVLLDRGITGVDGVLADLGVSSLQLDSAGRGFSFRRDEPLDMRMDRSHGATAAELLAEVGEEDLVNIIYRFGEERFSRRISRSIVNARRAAPIDTTGKLADIVRRSVPHHGRQRIDPATRTFQAVRIWVNGELEGLDTFIRESTGVLLRGARLASITVPSLEERIVKHACRAIAAGEAALRVLTRKPIVPGEDECARNPRARSAKLRAIERLA